MYICILIEITNLFNDVAQSKTGSSRGLANGCDATKTNPWNNNDGKERKNIPCISMITLMLPCCSRKFVDKYSVITWKQ